MSDYQFEGEGYQPGSEGEPRSNVDWSRVEYGGFWVRVITTIIDTIISVLVFIFLIGVLILGMDPMSYGGGGELTGALINYGLPALYSIGFWIWLQATPGKMALGLVVVDANTGQPASAGKYVLRYIGYILSAIVLLIGFFWVAFNPRKQGWHDLIAGTVVVKKDSL